MVSLLGKRLNVIAQSYLGNGCNHHIYSGNGGTGVKRRWIMTIKATESGNNVIYHLEPRFWVELGIQMRVLGKLK